MARRIAEALTRRGETLATVECSLGGALGDVLTDVAGASAWFVAAVVPYSAGAKSALLGLDREAFGADGVVSAFGAAALARAGKECLGADWALAETGIAGPRGQHRSSKEPGTDHLCLVGPAGLEVSIEVGTGHDDRLANKAAFLSAALDLISTNVEIPVI
jgi:nicotinamide-nucleotide amidase